MHHGVIVEGANGFPGQDPVLVSRLLNSAPPRAALEQFPDVHLAVVLSQNKMIYDFGPDADAIYAIGGTYQAPTLLVSGDRGRSFEEWITPPTSGLRGVCAIDGAVWIIGEYGLCAVTRDRGATWTAAPRPG